MNNICDYNTRIKIIIDYTTIINAEKRIGAYIGAGNFARELLRELKKKDIDIFLIVTKGFTPKPGEEQEIMSSNITFLYEAYNSIDYGMYDILLLPATNGYLLEKIRKIKANANILVYAFIHDKQHNIRCFDPMDRFYYSGFNRNIVVLWWKYILKRVVFNCLYPIWIKNIDKVFTVSNYSMQRLGDKNIKFITFYYQNTVRKVKNKQLFLEKEEEYVLFVSGGRCEKNLARTLLAFMKYVNSTGCDLKLYITGIDAKTLDILCNNIKIPKRFIEKSIVQYDYISDEQLDLLYSNCKYLVFTSKAEGFGLPVLEAMQHGKTVLASRHTSIPEVAGSILYYVDAYSSDSIYDGMKYLGIPENLEYREQLVAKKMEIINKQIELDREVMIKEILSN